MPRTPEEEADRAEWVEEMIRAAQEAALDPDPELDEVLERKHPLAERAFEFNVRLIREVDESGWIPPDAPADHAVADLVSSIMQGSAKLAGALNGETWPPDVDVCGSIIVRLKRARAFFEHALLAAEFCAEHQLLPKDRILSLQRDVISFVHESDHLIEQARAKLHRGFD